MKISIGSDHIGFFLKEEVILFLKELGYEVEDMGPFNSSKTDYPIYGKAVAHSVVSKESDLGILICGSGVGISLAANKVKGIRAVVCSEPFTARLSREHNDTNILSLGAWIVGNQMAKEIISEWLRAEYQGGGHQARVDMIES